MIHTEQIASEQLAGNVIGDPSTRDLVIYLPPSYGSSTRRYPTVYLLHGFGGHAIGWVTPPADRINWRPPIDDVVGPAIAKHQAAEMIVVMPDGWSRYGCSQWVDSPVNGYFEQYVAREVVAYVDSHYRTLPNRESRGVVGISSGGLGAWHLGSRNPEVFGAMVLLSADSYFELTHKPWFYTYYDSIYPQEPSGPVDGNAESALCYGIASCYTPNVDKPPYYVDLPVDFPSGEVIAPLWERWLSYDPVVSWRDRQQNLRHLRGILLDVGYRDEYDLHYGHRLLSRALSGAGITHHAEEHPGTHGGRLPERIQFALRWFSETLDLNG
jgi:S-formylglutathione hydrolase FrmB